MTTVSKAKRKKVHEAAALIAGELNATIYGNSDNPAHKYMAGEYARLKQSMDYDSAAREARLLWVESVILKLLES